PIFFISQAQEKVCGRRGTARAEIKKIGKRRCSPHSKFPPPRFICVDAFSYRRISLDQGVPMSLIASRRRWASLLAAALLFGLAVPNLRARYIRPQIEMVP